MSFPSTALRRYKALSMIMVLNWMSSMARKASGTWSSERVEAMSAAALCFYNTTGVTPSARQSGRLKACTQGLDSRPAL